MASPGNANTNEALRTARTDQGWYSQEQAADQISTIGQRVLGDPYFHISPRTWRRWESAIPGWPRPDTAIVLRAVFGTGPEHLGFTPPPGHPAATVRTWPDPLPEDPVKRRHFLAAGPAAALAASTPALAAPAPGRVDAQLVGYFTQQLNGHYTADMLLGPLDLLGTVSEQYRLISTLCRQATGPVRHDLTRVGAAYAVLAGWLHQDAGQWEQARSWHGTALADAQTADDPDLHAYTLANLAYLHVELGDGHASITLCERGLHLTGLPPIARMQLTYQQAHGHSLLGDHTAVDTLLDAAQHTAHTRPENPPTPWGRTAALGNPHFFDIQRATCYGRLGLHSRAQPLWERVTAAVPDTARRRAGIYLARQATAHAALGEPEQALALATESARIAAETRSARHIGELRTLRDRMSRWNNTPLRDELEHAFRPISA
ncbi:helix-turn-helix transcriptional regulator [Streptomyces yaizuensis]|uniref:Helix-turn-helix domain-containing protein n=1 Tax=Streptomyces yaizuensis TaxID=2989713 RepID=A0ABQ5NYF0_9ACTN|nr:helix-turn-helix transcriptional regulator [Streptomyces sp. YSPA8]GLF95210.1 helix-turn-helix domain-containing protein [Streptomyces sp. YSPA8]